MIHFTRGGGKGEETTQIADCGMRIAELPPHPALSLEAGEREKGKILNQKDLG